MKMHFESHMTIPAISDIFCVLTNGARVCLDKINYDETKGFVEILIQRKELLEVKKSFFWKDHPIYSQKLTDTMLTIKDVVGMRIKYDDRLVSECNSCFTVLFGLKINQNELYLGSVEEFRGIVLCQIFIQVKKINIECVDI